MSAKCFWMRYPGPKEFAEERSKRNLLRQWMYTILRQWMVYLPTRRKVNMELATPVSSTVRRPFNV